MAASNSELLKDLVIAKAEAELHKDSKYFFAVLFYWMGFFTPFVISWIYAMVSTR